MKNKRKKSALWFFLYRAFDWIACIEFQWISAFFYFRLLMWCYCYTLFLKSFHDSLTWCFTTITLDIYCAFENVFGLTRNSSIAMLKQISSGNKAVWIWYTDFGCYRYAFSSWRLQVGFINKVCLKSSPSPDVWYIRCK